MISDGPTPAGGSSSLHAIVVAQSRLFSDRTVSKPLELICSDVTGTGSCSAYERSDAVELELDTQLGTWSFAAPAVVPIVTAEVIAEAASISPTQNFSLVPLAATQPISAGQSTVWSMSSSAPFA